MLTARSAKNWFADRTDADRIAKWVDDANKRSSLKINDLILSTRGTVGLCALITEEVLPANIDQDVARIAINKKGVRPEYILVYLNSTIGQDWLLRNQSGMVQQGVALSKLRNMPIPILSPTIQNRIAAIVADALSKRNQSRVLYTDAETRLLESLGLKDWKPAEPLSYIAKSSNAMAAERLDAEYFKPKYRHLLDILITSGFKTLPLGNLLKPIVNGFDSREFVEDGTPYIRVGDVTLGRVNLEGCKRVPILSTEVVKDVSIIEGDILFTRKGSFGNCSVATHETQSAIISSEIMRLRLKTEVVIPEFLAAYLNSTAGRLQVEKCVHGVAFYSISQPDLAAVIVAIPPLDIQREVEALVKSSHTTIDESKLLLEKAKRAVEIAIEEGEEAAGRYLDGKAYVQESALPDLMGSHAYFSTEALRDYLKKQKLTYSPQTVNTYISRMKSEGAIYSAGRGWYSSVAEPHETDRASVAELVGLLESRFSLLDFTCWSTGQLNSFLEHTLGKPVAFVYVERDGMPSVYEFLKESGYNAYLNPTQQEAKKLFSVGDKTVVVRPSIEKAPVEGHFARIEKLLVDVLVEREHFNLMDADEFREAAQRLVVARRIELAKLIMYAGQRKADWRAIFSAPDKIIAEGDA